MTHTHTSRAHPDELVLVLRNPKHKKLVKVWCNGDGWNGLTNIHGVTRKHPSRFLADGRGGYGNRVTTYKTERGAKKSLLTKCKCCQPNITIEKVSEVFGY